MDKSSKTEFKNLVKLKYGPHNIYICLILLIVVRSSVSLQTQTTRGLSKPFVTSNAFDPARGTQAPLQTQTATSPALLTTTGANFLSSATARGAIRGTPTTMLPTQAQPQRSLKFTLIGGKYWKFNIKTNSLLHHGEKELRLHRNISANNYIIDDDGWFQYNHQQQQLFAWPSYNTKPATYYFVLLPSGLDYEADGENVIRDEDIVANIIVELIEPYTTSKLDLDHLVDHKFSLDYLHRHSSYPLLLSQIVSIFVILSRSSSSPNAPSTTQSQNTETATTTTASSNILLTTLQQQNRQARSSSRLSEFLLIDAQTSQDGEFFSITWTTHPALVNNAPLLPISDCRLNTINETIYKLSSRSVLYPNVDSKFVISYSLEDSSVNSAAIIPTEKGNYALKLKLNGPCRRKKVVDELGLSSDLGSFNDLIPKIDEKENGILDAEEILKTKQTPTTSVNRFSTSTDPILPSREPSRTTTTLAFPPSPRLVTSTSQPHIDTTAQSYQITVSKQLPTAPVPVLQPSTNVKSDTTSLPRSEVEVENTTTNTRRAVGTSATQASFARTTPPPHFQFSPKHQPKSFANFLEPVHGQPASTTMADVSNSEITSVQTTSSSSSITTTTPLQLDRNGTTSTLSSTESGQETSLNDDLMGIINDTMNYLVSIAVPLSIIFGIILVASILIAICNLCMKRRKSKQFEVGDRFKFRYGSERKGFLKNSSKPVILEADQKSLSMGGTPIRQPRLDPKAAETDKMLGNSKVKSSKKNKRSIPSDQSGSNFFSMHVFPSSGGGHSSGYADEDIGCADFGADSGGGDCGGDGGGGGDCGGGDGGGCD